MIKFSIIITTKNRLEDLKISLKHLELFFFNENVECLICDDGSDDETSLFLEENYPKIILFRNEKSKGLIYCRNKLMNKSKGEYIISLDDDLNFLISNPLEIIENHFKLFPNCGVVSFRIFWSKFQPKSKETFLQPYRVRSFAGGAHAWRKTAWQKNPNYPCWFVFYGEEDYASFNLFKNNIEIYFLPEILTHHRVSLIDRKNDKDYFIRLRRSLRSGWYLYFLFLPSIKIPKLILSSLKHQVKNKLFKGEIRIITVIFMVFIDVIFNIFNIIKNTNKLTIKEYEEYSKIPSTLIYWNPENEVKE